MNANARTRTWAALLAIGAALPGTAYGQIMLNVPPDPAPALLTNAEVLNLLSGGSLGGRFIVGEDAVLNVQGGAVGSQLRAIAASTVNVTRGSVGDRWVLEPGSTTLVSGGRLGDDGSSGGDLTVTGGVIGNSMAANGGTVRIAGGQIGVGFSARQGSVVHMTGGIVDEDFYADRLHMHGGTIGDLVAINATFYGADFRLNGNEIAGLENPGDRVVVDVFEPGLFTGVLADGTPFAFSFSDSGDIFYGPVELVREVPPAAPEVINVPQDPVPYGIRAGQILNLHSGGVLPDNFVAGEGSVVNILGGQVGKDFEAFGATVNLHAGLIGEQRNSMDAFDGTVVNVWNGRIGEGASVWSGATVNLLGGSIGRDFHARAGSSFNMSGGNVDRGFSAWPGSMWELSGGRYGVSLSVGSGLGGPDEPGLTIYGFGFRVDEELVEGLNEPGDEVILPTLDGTGAVVTGNLSDRTPFVLRESNDQRVRGPVRLVLTGPQTDGEVITLPIQPSPSVVGWKQVLNVGAGGVLGDYFAAGVGSTVNIDGGSVGDFFQAVRANVHIRSGTIGGAFDAFFGADVTISGGTFGPSFDAYSGSIITIEGTRFTLDGVPFGELNQPGDSLVVIERGGRQLQATLADGSLFGLTLESRPDVLAFGHDYVDPDATLRLVLVGRVIPEPATVLLVAAATACSWIGRRFLGYAEV